MAELDGVWNVKRVGGALPPLVEVRKEIHGEEGCTRVGPLLCLRFDVCGLELRYRGPWRGFIDRLEPDGERYRGVATFHGREFARFLIERAKESGVAAA